MCGSQPAANVQVKLLDEDHGKYDSASLTLFQDGAYPTFRKSLILGDPDDMLDHMITKEDGVFNVSGFASELTPIDPELRIYHDCNDHGKVRLELFLKNRDSNASTVIR